jgi:hypothetical protein
MVKHKTVTEINRENKTGQSYLQIDGKEDTHPVNNADIQRNFRYRRLRAFGPPAFLNDFRNTPESAEPKVSNCQPKIPV